VGTPGAGLVPDVVERGFMLWIADGPGSMIPLAERIASMAASDASVLVTGESAASKALLARSLHDRSPRAAKPFVAVRCAALPVGLLEAELLGHGRGFMAARGGTLFLDEVAAIPLVIQVKLLGALEVDVRVIAATRRDLRDRIARGLFRADLYYRLKVLDLTLGAPPPAISHLFAAARKFEREYLLRALALSGGRQSLAAESLGISRTNLGEKLWLHGIVTPEEA
jgi:DNA-binding NtrC family response regulator